VTYHTKKDNSR